MTMSNAQRQAEWRNRIRERADALAGTPAEIADNILRQLKLEQTRYVTEALTQRLAAIKPDCSACHGTGFIGMQMNSACGVKLYEFLSSCDCSAEAQRDPDAYWMAKAAEKQKQEEKARRRELRALRKRKARRRR